MDADNALVMNLIKPELDRIQNVYEGMEIEVQVPSSFDRVFTDYNEASIYNDAIASGRMTSFKTARVIFLRGEWHLMSVS